MSAQVKQVLSVALWFAAILLALFSAFFVFYTLRLYYVTSGLRAIRAGGQGAYIGAIVFPLLAVLSGWGAWRCVRMIRRG